MKSFKPFFVSLNFYRNHNEDEDGPMTLTANTQGYQPAHEVYVVSPDLYLDERGVRVTSAQRHYISLEKMWAKTDLPEVIVEGDFNWTNCDPIADLLVKLREVTSKNTFMPGLFVLGT